MRSVCLARLSDLRVPDLVGNIRICRRLDRTAERAIDADLQFADPN